MTVPRRPHRFGPERAPSTRRGARANNPAEANEAATASLPGHILPTASTMVGVCMTVISIIKLTQATQQGESWVDELLTVDAFVFMTSAVCSYLALRRQSYISRAKRLERTADTSFIVGLGLMACVIFIITFRLA